MPVNVAAILGAIAALACTVLILVFITPEKKRAGLNKFFRFLHDLFNFNFLIIEKLLKVLYIFVTVFVLCTGFFMLFSVQRRTFFYGGTTRWLGGWGLLIMVVGPVIVRLVYELLMMAILLVKNVIQINRKLPERAGDSGAGTPGLDGSEPGGVSFGFPDRGAASDAGQSPTAPDAGQPPVPPQPQAPVQPPVQSQPQARPAPAAGNDGSYVFCPHCGARLPCGTVFCPNCGTRIS